MLAEPTYLHGANCTGARYIRLTAFQLRLTVQLRQPLPVDDLIILIATMTPGRRGHRTAAKCSIKVQQPDRRRLYLAGSIQPTDLPERP